MRANLKFIVGILLLSAVLAQSCTATKKDCRGKKKHRLSNGIWM